MRFREWSKLGYMDPAKLLAGSRDMLRELSPQLGRFAASVMRSRPGKEVLEDQRCAVFCFGMAAASGATIKFSDTESSDYDYILSVTHKGAHSFVPLQMKQLVPASVNPTTSLQSEIDKLKKYATSADLVVAIHINRCELTALEALDLSNLNIGELWLFGVSDPDRHEWRIIGNLLSANPSIITFQLPAA